MTLSFSEVPLTSGPQTFSTSLNGVLYNLRFTWNKPSQCWIMDIADANDVPILTGTPLTTGSDLLEQFAYLGLGGAMIMVSDVGPDIAPTFFNLGSAAHLLFVTQNG